MTLKLNLKSEMKGSDLLRLLETAAKGAGLKCGNYAKEIEWDGLENPSNELKRFYMGKGLFFNSVSSPHFYTEFKTAETYQSVEFDEAPGLMYAPPLRDLFNRFVSSFYALQNSKLPLPDSDNKGCVGCDCG